MTRRRHQVMWVAGAAAAALAAAGAGLLASPPEAHADTSAGTGSAYAQAVQVTPHDGSLAVGAILAEALAGHTNDMARAQSQGLDLGAIGLSLSGYNCGTQPSPTQEALVPRPLQTETGDPGASNGIEQQPTTGLSSTSSSSFPPSFGSTEFVQATGTPYGEADTSYGQIQAPGVPFSLSGVATKAWSGLVNGVREAGATADIQQLSLVGGAVTLDGLHWQVVYPSGGSAQPSGSFSIGKLVAGGQTLTAPALSTVESVVNQVLANLGVELVLPAVSVQQDVEYVTPLEIEVLPSATRDQVLQTVVNGLAPATSPLFTGLESGFGPPEPAQLAQALCQSDTPVTVADVSIASMDGGGFFNAAFGGVHASSGAVAANPYNLSLGGLAPLDSTQFVAGSDAIPGTPGTPGSGPLPGSALTAPAAVTVPASPAAPATAPAATAAHPTSAQQDVSPASLAEAGFAPGGPLLAVGLGGLGLLALLAEADRRMMRKAQHSSGFESFEE